MEKINGSAPDPEENDTSASSPSDPGESPDEDPSLPPAPIRQFLQSIVEQGEKIQEEVERERRELYGDERFEDDGLTYADDLAAYDQAAYTRNTLDYSAYRYNLNQAAPQPQLPPQDPYGADPDGYYGESYDDGLAGDLDAGSVNTGGHGFGSSKSTGAGSQYPAKSGTTKGGKGGYAYSYTGSGSWNSWGGGWMSSWYSGYNSAELAIRGVHDSVSPFLNAEGFGGIEIVPDLESVSDGVGTDPYLNQEAGSRNPYSRSLSETDRIAVVRIDSTLYEKLGIAEAQQHYVVDAISQLFSIQSYPDPFLITLLQSCQHKTVIPSVTKEIITEMMRAKGLPKLIDQMPGWLKRVTAFRSAMYVGEPPDGSIPSMYLMYAIWERDVVNSIEHQDAIKVIDEIEDILNSSSHYLPALERLHSHKPINRGDLIRTRESILERIDTALVRYIAGHGSAGEVLRILREMHRRATEKREKHQNMQLANKDWPADREIFQEACDQLVPLVHDHNRTFCPDPSDISVVKHQDFPDCPNVALLRNEVKARIEFSRKCLFNFNVIPSEVTTKGVNPETRGAENLDRGIKRISDMIQHIEKAIAALLEAAERAMGGTPESGEDRDRGTSCTNHPELRCLAPVGGNTDRNFRGEDPTFDREVVVFDATL